MKACRRCRLIIEKENTCPACNASDLTTDYGGMVLVMDPEKSEVAQLMNVKIPGKYATNVK